MLISTRRVAPAVAAAMLLAVPWASAQTPLGTAFTYQGDLKAGGSAASGLHDLRFRLFDGAAGGAQVGPTLCADNVSVTGGRFSVALDFGAEFAGHERFLEIEVRADTGLGCANAAGFVLLSPRQPLTASPHAIFALGAADAAQLDGRPPAFYSDASNLSTGTLPEARLSSNVARLGSAQTFTGAATFSAAPAFSAGGAPFSVASTTLVPNLNADRLDGLDASAFLQAVPSPLNLAGSQAGSHVVKGSNSSTTTGAVGVLGEASAPGTEENFGVLGRSASTKGRGIYGIASATTGTNFGGYFQTDSASGYALYGIATAASGGTYGGLFRTDSPGGTAVYGWATATTGGTHAGYFHNSSSSGTGVRGVSNVFGVYGLAGGTTGTAVYGLAAAAVGPTVGVMGEHANFDGWAVYAAGRFGAGGVKAFRIDHPLDPENRWLQHYCMEGPEPLNIYTGTVTTDAAGYATVLLPAYFEEINRDPRVQLTVVDAGDSSTFALAKVVERPRDGRFRIRTSAPGVEVFWEVKAVRDDRWMRKYGAPVEPEKIEHERGKYQFPDLYGLPRERGFLPSSRDEAQLLP